MAYAAKILADSIHGEHRLTTFEVTFPRLILAEVNTHRTLSRNSASSRAIPVEKQIQRVLDDPFVPEQWPSEFKGMSGGPPLTGKAADIAGYRWLEARDRAVEIARLLVEDCVHKSLVNRLLEPFMWHTAIISATEWSNFFALRTDANAQPEFRKIALMMQELYATCPWSLERGQWHLPLVNDDELVESRVDHKMQWDYWKKVSVGRCARVSYLTHDGKRNPEKDIELHDRLMTNGHLSPFEHQATPDPVGSGNFRGWTQYRAFIPNEDDFAKVVRDG